MSSLVAPRPPGWRMHEEDDRQGSLFGGDAFQPPERPRPESPRATPAPREKTSPPEVLAVPPEVIAPPEARAARPEVIAAPEDLAAPPEVSAAPDLEEAAVAGDIAAPAPREFVVPHEGAEEIRVSRGTGSALTGPTLDDAVSRAWEGLVAGLPAACPVCHIEIEPALSGSLRGHCRSCHVTLD
jgi:hypothetical protein